MQPKIVTLSKKQMIGLGLQQLIRRENVPFLLILRCRTWLDNAAINQNLRLV